MKESSIKHFLFLEFHDRDFNAFYDDAVLAITGTPPLKPPHLTVRGPYRRPIGREELEKFREAMKFAVLRIGGVGRFSNPGEEVVYMEVESPQLRTIWWKPDYPIGSFGYNPHISLYRGRDADLADRIAAYKPLRDVVFMCAEYKLVPVVKDRAGSRELGLREINRAHDHARLESRNGFPADFFSQLQLIATCHSGDTRGVRESARPAGAQTAFDL